MKKKIFVLVMIMSFPFLISDGYVAQTKAEDLEDKNIRPSILAGTWYPGSQDALTKMIDGYLSNVKTESLQGNLKAIIVPHAGYTYSGQVAAHAYKLLKKTDFKTVVMIGPSHRIGFRGVSINLQSGYKTPLGVVRVDQTFAKKLLNSGTQFKRVPQAHALEHSLEIQLPFLQTVLKDFQIVPILMGKQDFRTCSDLAKSLNQVLSTSEKTLLLASTDLSHFYNYNRAKELDLEFIKHIRGFDPKALGKSLSSGSCEACGGGPAIATMLAAQETGANRAVILKYANSGDVTGDHSRVVGYLSAALVNDNE